MQIQLATSSAEVRALADRLNKSKRTLPVVVISTPAQQTEPYIDVERIQREVGDVAELIVLPTGEPSWAFSEEMADMTQVYGGAGRVYPVGLEWVHDPSKAPLRFAFSKTEGERAGDQIIADALAMASAAGLFASSGVQFATPFAGKVLGFAAGRAMVRADNGDMANIVPELIAKGIPAEQLVRPGMRVEGKVDSVRRLDIRSMLQPSDRLAYEVDDVVLARVEKVTEGKADLRIHPDVVVRVKRRQVTTNSLDALDALMTEGEVLRARVASVDPWELTLVDLEDWEVARTAFSLIEGGPPWLVEGVPATGVSLRDESPMTSTGKQRLGSDARPPTSAGLAIPTPAVLARSKPPVPEPAAPAPVVQPPVPSPPAVGARVAGLEGELREAREELKNVRSEVSDLVRENGQYIAAHRDAQEREHKQKATLADLRKQLRKKAGEQVDNGPWFIDAEDQLRFDIYAAWVRRVPAPQKPEQPLAEYSVGPEFIESLESVQGIKRQKVIDVAVEVLTGVAPMQTGREVHQLRRSDSGDSPPCTRDDGSTCWRVALQRNSPSARRLHYWAVPGGTVEFSRVVLHDDFEP